MFPQLKGKGLFIFSDPGGAKPILSLLESIKDQLQSYLVISDRMYPFFSDFDIPVSSPSKKAEDDFFYFKPDFVFTGTSYTSTIELHYIAQAKKLNIPSYSFVDHWTAIRERFNNNGIDIFPDKILVVDERAKKLAKEQGIDTEKILVTGNPYYEWLKKWDPSISKADFLDQIGLKDAATRLLVYAPDPLSNVNGIEKYGFDELTATAMLVELFETHRAKLMDWTVLVKTHPNQNREKLRELINHQPSFILLENNVDTNTCIYYADRVMGFFSSFLIEAVVLNKPVLRFLPVNRSQDPIAELGIGTITDRDSLISILITRTAWN